MADQKTPRALTSIANNDFWGWRDGSADEHRLLLQRVWVWFPVPTWRLTTVCNSSSRASYAFIGSSQHQVVFLFLSYITEILVTLELGSTFL